MAAGGGRPRCGVVIDSVIEVGAGKGGSDLLVAGSGGSKGTVDATMGENWEFDGGVGGV